MISVFSAVRDLRRLREITSVLVRHGFGEVVARMGAGRKPRRDSASEPPTPHEASAQDTPELSVEELAAGEAEKSKVSTAERIRLVLQELGPSFIKLGQIASTRNDLLPADVVTELRKLQDDVPAVPFADVKSVIEATLGAPLDKLYVSFDEKPLATASIGQVHRAVLRTPEGDRDVVVKVQRPNVANTVARDLELLHIMAAALERAIPETRIYSPIGLVQNFDRSITAELDFTIEAENAERFTKNFERSKHRNLVRFPQVYREASSKQVLTLEYFDGVKVDKAADAGIDPKRIARNAVAVIIQMAFEDGFFHADPHPGNVIILGGKPGDEDPNPVIGLIDVGMVGRLSPELRDRTIDLMLAAARKDGYGVADALYALGRPTRKVDMRDYRAYAATLAEKYLDRPLAEIDLAAMIRDLAQGAMKYGIEIPPDFMLVGKALMTLEIIAKNLDPELDLFSEARPYFIDLLKQRYSPQRLGNELIRGVEQLSRVGYDLPLQAREILDDLRLGRLVIKTLDPSLPVAADRLGRRLFSGLVVASLILAGAIALPHAQTFGAVLLTLGALLLLAHTLRDWLRP